MQDSIVMPSRIHDYDRMILLQEDLLEKSQISEEDKQLIQRFVLSKIAEGISEPRIAKYYSTLRLLAERFKPFEKTFVELTKEDLIAIAAKIERTKLKAWTKRDYKLFLKLLYKYLGRDVDFIKPKDPGNKLIPDDLITIADVKRMIDAAQTDRDKAFIACLYDGSFRISELGSAVIKDVNFDEYGARLMVNGKTGMRNTRLIFSVPYLSRWLEVHPLRKNREAPLWIMLDKHIQMTYNALHRQLRRIAERAGVQHKVNPHNFRHSRATHLAQHLSESLLCEYMGLTQGSKMVRTYVHLSGHDLDKSLLKLYGLEHNDKEQMKLDVVQCPFCRMMNTIDARICISCRKPLGAEHVIEKEKLAGSLFEDLLELSLSDPEVAEAVGKYFEKRKSKKT